MTIEILYESHPDIKPAISIWPRLRAQLRRELKLLLAEWNCATRGRRREIIIGIMSIYELLDEEG